MTGDCLMGGAQSLLTGALCLLMAGCGTYVPGMREWSDDLSLDESNIITALIRSVSCELSYTVKPVDFTSGRRASPA